MAFSPDAAFEFLQRAYVGGRLAHAYLITGEQGCGKRTLVKRLAGMVSGNGAGGRSRPEGDSLQHPDVHVAEPESKSRVMS